MYFELTVDKVFSGKFRNLRDNKISVIQTNAFLGTSTRDVHFSGNPLKTIESRAFSGSSHRCEH